MNIRSEDCFFFISEELFAYNFFSLKTNLYSIITNARGYISYIQSFFIFLLDTDTQVWWITTLYGAGTRINYYTQNVLISYINGRKKQCCFLYLLLLHHQSVSRDFVEWCLLEQIMQVELDLHVQVKAVKSRSSTSLWVLLSPTQEWPWFLQNRRNNM